jgi:hypothetical protein
MSRFAMALFCVAGLLLAAPGCGKYGRPVRTYEKKTEPAPASAAPDASAETEDSDSEKKR